MSKERPFMCKKCGQKIYVDDAIVSQKSGKRIPLTYDTDDPHECHAPEAGDLTELTQNMRAALLTAQDAVKRVKELEGLDKRVEDLEGIVKGETPLARLIRVEQEIFKKKTMDEMPTE